MDFPFNGEKKVFNSKDFEVIVRDTKNKYNVNKKDLTIV